MEIEIIKAIQSISSPFLDNVFQAITFLGEETIYVLLLTFIYWNLNKKLGKSLGFSLFLSVTVNSLIKDIFKFKRPIGEPGIRSLRVETATGYSFPSGHSQGTATFLSSLAMNIKNNIFTVFASVLILLVGLSRLYLGVHYPKDVVVGIFLGVLIAYISYRIFEKGFNKRLVYGSLAIVFVLCLFFSGSEGYIKACAGFLGFMAGDLFEEKYVNFTVDISRIKKIARWTIGIIIILLVKVVGKSILPESIVSDFFRYFAITFIGLGLYPYIFKKINL